MDSASKKPSQSPENPGDHRRRQHRTPCRTSPRLARRSTSEKDEDHAVEDIPQKKYKADTNEYKAGEVEPGTSISKLEKESGPSRPLTRSPLRPEKPKQNRDLNDVSAGDKGDVINKELYHIKWIQHDNRRCPIITQNQNGPCPLIAVVNVLLLQGKLVLSTERVDITEEELLSLLNGAIADTLPKDTRDVNPDMIQNVQDAISLLPGLATGLNVNIKFSGVKDFEYTPECLVFDTLRIPLFHGWLYDPQSLEVSSAIGPVSYNQLVELIIKKKVSEDPEQVAEALIAENFLEGTASQLTVYGLCELNESITKGQLGVLFRNNHFIVLYKHENILCQLVTDQGFLDEPEVVWETLSNINGDEVFLNSAFKNTLRQSRQTDPSEEQQISQEITPEEHEGEQRQIASKSTTPPGETSVPSSSQGISSPSNQDDTSKWRDWKCSIC